jgi:hypothetical protein
MFDQFRLQLGRNRCVHMTWNPSTDQPAVPYYPAMNNENEEEEEEKLSNSYAPQAISSSLAGEEELGGLRHGVVEPPAGPVHELGAEAEHEHAELHLAERAVAVEVALGEHPAEVVVGHGAQAQQRRAAAEAVEGDEPAGRVHEQAEPARQLPHQALLAQPLRHQRQVVLEPHGRRRRGRARLLLLLLLHLPPLRRHGRAIEAAGGGPSAQWWSLRGCFC